MSLLDDESELDGQSFSDPSSLTIQQNYTIHAFLIFSIDFDPISALKLTELSFPPGTAQTHGSTRGRRLVRLGR